jgi:hypothetical protein
MAAAESRCRGQWVGSCSCCKMSRGSRVLRCHPFYRTIPRRVKSDRLLVFFKLYIRQTHGIVSPPGMGQRRPRGAIHGFNRGSYGVRSGPHSVGLGTSKLATFVGRKAVLLRETTSTLSAPEFGIECRGWLVGRGYRLNARIVASNCRLSRSSHGCPAYTSKHAAQIQYLAQRILYQGPQEGRC